MEGCVVSAHSHRAPSEHTGQAVNSTVRLTENETKMTNGPTCATVHPYNLQQQVAPRRQGPWVPSLSRNGFFGAPPLGAIPTLVRKRGQPRTPQLLENPGNPENPENSHTQRGRLRQTDLHHGLQG